ncbi:MAG: PqqD family peptide modification chaperone [Lachnospiraceae bacterium]|nr:PqqD family peptide modification chaperone [Lachnospiraceae bacterium]
MKPKEKAGNYLDYIPRIVEEYKWEKDGEDNVTIFVENKGIYNRIAQKLFGRPKVSQIHLQGIGNYIWPLIDGKKSIHELGARVKEHYGDEAEPLYERLTEYMKMLEQYGFIVIEKK